MCGIIAYIGYKKALPFLNSGLEKLEYRGYDSAGISIVEDTIKTVKCKGKVLALKKKIKEKDLNGYIGIGHTRWATHGIPSDINSHPHTNHHKTISIVHNGIIENYLTLKEELIHRGYTFQSDTDTEVIVHLIDYYYENNLLDAVNKVLPLLKGSYALGIVSLYNDEIIVCKKDSPLVIGKLNDGMMASSDIYALMDYTDQFYFLEDKEIAVLKKDSIVFYNENNKVIFKSPTAISLDNTNIQKDGYETFMEKEIFEQPKVIKEIIKKRLNNDKITFNELKDINFKKYNKIYFIACGTAYHACLYGSKVLQRLTHMPISAMTASEFRYDYPVIDKKTLTIAVSQSGETADTLAALRLAKSFSSSTIAICNVLGSSIAREADYVLYTYAGFEIAVASTKAYTAQLITFILLSCFIADRLNMKYDLKIINQLKNLPEYIDIILNQKDIIKEYAHMIKDHNNVYFIGRGMDYISGLEGALKLKEISYIHAHCYLAGELKHGPIALIEEGSQIIAIALESSIRSKTYSNIEETVARGANVIVITNNKDEFNHYNHVYLLPMIDDLLNPIIAVIPLQLIAYYSAYYRGCDVDKPRNLAKSVTVE